MLFAISGSCANFIINLLVPIVPTLDIERFSEGVIPIDDFLTGPKLMID
jgi:hypothetical protein